MRQLGSKGSKDYNDYREELLKQQDQRCKVCGYPVEFADHTYHIEHDHKTWQVRGVTCHSCNSLLGGIEKHWRSGANKKDAKALGAWLVLMGEYLQEDQQEVLYSPKPVKRKKK